jgi:hypothetical protein
VDYAFGILASVAQGETTQWSIVYDLDAMRVYLRTSLNPRIRYFDVSDFDFSCDTPVRILDIHKGGDGDIRSNFQLYSTDANRDLIRNAFRNTHFLRNTPPEDLEAIALYPLSTQCEN